MENLKEIGGFPGYCVDNTGNVFSVKTDVMLKPWKINGYNAVGLYRSGKRYVFLVHRLVAAAFIPNPDNKQQVDHINGNLIKTYISFAEAKKSGFLRKGICKNLDGKTKNYNGFVWKRLL